jgi:hypothetical protein
LKVKKSNFNNTTRWLPDSSFATYCGKSPWHCYGKGNVNPAVGGLNYGNYLLSHNINSESGERAPMYQQVYDNALQAGIRQTKGFRVSQLPKTKEIAVITEE